jgi:hypothetical protein
MSIVDVNCAVQGHPPAPFGWRCRRRVRVKRPYNSAPRDGAVRAPLRDWLRGRGPLLQRRTGTYIRGPTSVLFLLLLLAADFVNGTST